jgi:hypothetical protein
MRIIKMITLLRAKVAIGWKHLESKLSEVLPIKSNLYSERVRNKADLWSVT